MTAQRLAGPPPRSGADGIMQLVRHLGCLQLDPISVVAPSHRLVLWSRLGGYSPRHLEALQWETRQLFEYWAHAASIVLTEDYPIHRQLMSTWRHGEGWSRHVTGWVTENATLKRHVLRTLRARGPLPAAAFEDRSEREWKSSGWTGGRNVDRMLAYLWISGVVVVARREAGRRWWDLAERWLPEWTPRDRPSQPEVVRRAAQRSLRALGIARRRDIERHFTAGRYPGLSTALASLERAGTIVQVEIQDQREHWPGPWYVHAEDLLLLDRIEGGEWQPRTTLLSPFDNLIRDRDRTRLLFGFDYTIEIYTPAAKRKFGYYVLPVLHGDQLIGRIDPAVDRKQRRLTLRAIHVEQEQASRSSGDAVAGAIAELARFAGADAVTPVGAIPSLWRSAFRRAF